MAAAPRGGECSEHRRPRPLARSLDRSIDHFLPTAVSPGLTKVFMVDSAM